MTTRLYHHKTDGGAEYLCTSPIEGTDEGDLHTAIIRLDGEPELLNPVLAASHDVLDALKALYKLYCPSDNPLSEEGKQARAAIRKAEGAE